MSALPIPAAIAGIAFATVAGVAMGMLVRRVVGRFVPVPPRARAVVPATAVIYALVAGWSLTVPAPWPPAARIVLTAAYLAVAALSLALAAIDLATHRLPNALVLPALPAVLLAFALATALGAPVDALARSVVAAAAVFGFFLAMRIARAGVGGGDVKLAALVGAVLGWAGWGAVVLGLVAAFFLGGIHGVVLLATRRADRRTRIPFGPWMLLGMWAGLVAGERIGAWYLGGGPGA